VTRFDPKRSLVRQRDYLQAKVERLEAALRMIAAGGVEYSTWDREMMRRVARMALGE